MSQGFKYGEHPPSQLGELELGWGGAEAGLAAERCRQE